MRKDTSMSFNGKEMLFLFMNYYLLHAFLFLNLCSYFMDFTFDCRINYSKYIFCIQVQLINQSYTHINFLINSFICVILYYININTAPFLEYRDIRV